MRLKLEQLSRHLTNGLKPIYLIFGDEPLQVGEAADTVRAAVRKAGYGSRERFDATGSFDWNQLTSATQTRSLFAEQRILELRLGDAKPGVAGGKTLRAYAQSPPPDILLLVIAGKLDKGAQNSAWFKALDKAGAVIRIWPVAVGQMPGWIRQRMMAQGLQPDREAVAILADRTEGNLLAAAQEIARLRLLQGEGPVNGAEVLEAVADSARYDVYKLADAALQGDVARCARVLSGLRAEGVEPVLVLWSVAREVRGLAAMAYDMGQGQALETVLTGHGVWSSRKALVKNALRRGNLALWRRLVTECAALDRCIKGLERDPFWDRMLTTLMAMAGEERLLYER